MKKLKIFIIFFCLCLKVFTQIDEENFSLFFSNFISSSIPKDIIDNILKNNEEFCKELKHVLDIDTDNLLVLVDKNHFLDKDYIPKDIINLSELKNRAYSISSILVTQKIKNIKTIIYIRDVNDIRLAKIAESPLQKMSIAAKKDKITLVVSSAYRSFEYQTTLFDKYVKKDGKQKAMTYSAMPGTSQHQLGTTIDFGTINDSFAYTPQGKWLYKNAYKYGWSLSYPKGYEKVTGYKWECWHYRYIGVEACKLQKKWFNDIQQYMLEFIYEWKKAGLNQKM